MIQRRPAAHKDEGEWHLLHTVSLADKGVITKELDEGFLDDLEDAVQEPVDSSGKEGELTTGSENEVALGSLTDVSHKEILWYVVLVDVEAQHYWMGGAGLLAVAINVALHQAGLGQDGRQVGKWLLGWLSWLP